MRDLLKELSTAREKKVYSDNEFEDYLLKQKNVDEANVIRWDLGAGEEWASLYNKDLNVTFMFNVRIGICFAIYTALPSGLSSLLNEIHFVKVDSFETQEWKLDLKGLRDNVPEIIWHASDGAVDCDNLSIQDLYWATV